MIAIALKLGYTHGDGKFEVGTPAPAPWMFSTILALQVADGLARFQTQSPEVIYHQNTTNVSSSFAHELTDINLKYSWTPQNQPFDVVARRNTSQWTEVTWCVMLDPIPLFV